MLIRNDYFYLRASRIPIGLVVIARRCEQVGNFPAPTRISLSLSLSLSLSPSLPLSLSPSLFFLFISMRRKFRVPKTCRAARAAPRFGHLCLRDFLINVPRWMPTTSSALRIFSKYFIYEGTGNIFRSNYPGDSKRTRLLTRVPAQQRGRGV